MLTCRERIHSPSALAWGSNRVEAATPCPSSPRITTLTAPRFGSGCTSTGSCSASGTSSLTRSGVTNFVSQATRSAPWWVWSTHSPTFASPPLSPERAWTNVPRGSRRVTWSCGACAATSSALEAISSGGQADSPASSRPG